MESIWKQNIEFEERLSLQNNINIHTVVIGAGMSGILTAYFLQNKGYEVVIVDAKRIASGQTQNTTAKITSQHDIFYNKSLKKIGKRKSQAYAAANEEAIHIYEQIIQKENISCHFEKCCSYLYTTEEKSNKKLQKEAQAAEMLGIKAHFVEGNKLTELPFKVSGAVCFENQAQFNPLEFIKPIAAKLKIYENTKVLRVKKHMVFTDKGNIHAETIVFATHYPFINIPGFYFLRQHQERSYVLALRNQKKLDGMYYSIDEDGLSFRSTEDVLLLGGGSHRTGKKSNELCGYTYMQKTAEIYYPDSDIAGMWSAQDCMPHDGIPFIGKYSIFRPYWYVATGFKKWGMTSSMISAVIISNLIGGISDSFQNTFTPQRFLFRASIKNLFIDIGTSISGLTKGLFSRKVRRCPHMGCRLKWNTEEHTWECPCHGSRFDYDGNLRDNPAQIDLNKKVP